MTPAALKTYLSQLINNRIRLSTMIWGPPGIGKSSIVEQVAQAHDLDFIDLRLSQLAPTDLRGLPVAIPTSKTKPTGGTSTWYPPDFLPRQGQGILFLDELNMAPPALQGVAQQLILDRKVGSYSVPDEWFIWAAGNRKEDRASVFDMPAPLGNRFLHLTVDPDFDSFKDYALAAGIHEQIIAFLSFRPGLLHKPDPQHSAWASPRTWAMASHLHRSGLDITPAVGEGSAAEFNAFITLYSTLPDLTPILHNQGMGIPFPTEPSTRYAVTIGLTMRAADATQSYHAFNWLQDRAPAEWVQLLGIDLFRQMRAKGQMGSLAKMVQKDPRLQKFLADYRELIGV